MSVDMIDVKKGDILMKEDNVNVKKMIIGIIIFAIIAVLVTIMMITINNSLTNNDENENVIAKENVIGTRKNQKYNQNDLELIKTQVQEEGLEYTSIRISGLKNKEIENRINEDIAREEENLKQIVLNSEMGEYDSRYLTEYENANFSNVLSLSFYGSKYGSNSRNEVNESRFLNYDLTTGNRLELEDLFVPGADIDLYVRNGIYTDLLSDIFYEKGVLYDPEYWESGEYTYVMSEIDEMKFLKEFTKYKNSEKKFYFTSKLVEINYGKDMDSRVYIKLKNCLNDLNIFTKFVTKESIFERDDIGVKNLYVCSDATTGNGFYAFVEDVTSNFRIDARINPYTGQGIMETKKYIDTFEKLKLDITSRKNDIEAIAKNNKDKYYYLGINITVNDFMPKYYCTYSDQDITHEDFYVYTEEALYEIDRSDFDNWFEDKLISACCLENYYEADGGYMNVTLSDDEKEKCKIDKKYDSVAYNVNSEKVYKNLEDLFKEDSNYLSIIDNVLQKEYNLSTDQVAEMIEKHEYQLSGYGVEFRNEEIFASVVYEKFSPDIIKQ